MIEAYQRAITQVTSPNVPRPAASGTFDHTISDYLSRREFSDLAPSTRAAKRGRFDWVRAKIGTARLADLEPHHVERLMDLKGGPSAANRLHKELVEIYAFAARHKQFSGTPPTATVARRKTKSIGFHTWTEDEVAAFRKRHASGTPARLALELMIGTGAARQDAAKLGKHNIKGGDIWYRRAKTGQDVSLPLARLPDLCTELRKLPSDQLIFVLSRRGTPYTTESFGNWFSDRCRDAGLERCGPHGLRKYGATRLAERGATEWQIMAFLAHKDPREARVYVQAASRKKLAADALAHLDGHEHDDEPQSVQHATTLDNDETQTTEK
ncbi:tyrosine-type recombinase/integrase [bacterium]|nr:tyrosine-type recombinase/integrase [bacterium]